jgi:hypothetical protein
MVASEIIFSHIVPTIWGTLRDLNPYHCTYYIIINIGTRSRLFLNILFLHIKRLREDIVHDTVLKMLFKFVALVLTYFDVLPILFDFEKRCACDWRNVDSVMRFCRWSTYRRGSADEHRFILKPTPHPTPPTYLRHLAFTITAFQFRKTKAWSVGGEAREMWAGSSYQQRPSIRSIVYSSGQGNILTGYLEHSPWKAQDSCLSPDKEINLFVIFIWNALASI